MERNTGATRPLQTKSLTIVGTSTAFFLPLILAGAYLNMGQECCGTNCPPALPPAPAPPSATQVDGELAVDLVATIDPIPTALTEVNFYRDGVLIGSNYVANTGQATFADTIGLEPNATYSYQVSSIVIGTPPLYDDGAPESYRSAPTEVSIQSVWVSCVPDDFGVKLLATNGCYNMYRNGYLWKPPNSLPWWVGLNVVDDDVLPGLTYTYSLKRLEACAAGAAEVSETDYGSVSVPAGCRPNFPRSAFLQDDWADGEWNMAFVPKHTSEDVPLYPVSEIEDHIFQDPLGLAAYVQEVSRGRIVLTGDVFDWSDGSAVGCDADPYEHRLLLIYSGSTECGTHGAPGYSNVGIQGPGENAHLGWNFTGGAAHESIGHGSGLGHAFAMVCPGDLPSDLSSIGPCQGTLTKIHHGTSSCVSQPETCEGLNCEGAEGSCFTYEYGDVDDPMGGGYGHFNTQVLLRLGWLDEEDELAIAASEAGQSSEHWVGALHRSTYPIKLLYVPLDDGTTFFLEFRNADGFDGVGPCSECTPPLYGGAPTPVGIRLRYSERAYGTRTFQILQEGMGPTFRFGAGDTYEDPARAISITVLEQNDDGALVRVER